MSQVFYRKWRPQTLGDVAGQEHVTQTLRHALETGRVAHAYLFCGPRGTGKTSTGRILAKAVNCLTNGKGEPCNACDMCQAITEGRALDLIEIDAASNRGIDDIRDLREKVRFSPSLARYKVYIVDEVHMLSEPAFNALLKTLEEPPPQTIFVLATTEVHKVPATILSRCQRFDFRRIPQAALIKRLMQVCQGEGVSADPAALALIARSAGGSLRDAENLLEQMVISYGSQVSLAQVQAIFGLSGDQRVRELVRYIIEGEVAAGLTTINRASADGLDLRQFNRELVEYLRGLLLIKAGAHEAVDTTTEALAEMRHLTDRASMEELVGAVSLFGQLDLRFEGQSTLPLELALVEHALAHPKGARPQVKAAAAAPLASPTPPPKEAATSAPAKASALKPSDKAAQPSAAAPETPPPPKSTPAAPARPEPVEPPPGGANLEYFTTHWRKFIEAMRGVGSKGNLDAYLRNACHPIDLEGDTLVLGFYYQLHMDKVQDPKYRHLVEGKLSEVFGGRYQVRCVLIGPTKTRPQGHLTKAALDMGASIMPEE